MTFAAPPATGLQPETLCALASKITVEQATALLALIPMPSGTPCLIPVVQTVTCAWPFAARELGTIVPSIKDAEAAIDSLRHYCNSAAELPSEFRSFGDANRLPLRGFVHDFPLYSMASRAPPDSLRFPELVAMVIICFATLRNASDRKGLDFQRFADRVRAGSRDVRRIPTAICSLLPVASSIATYHPALSELLADRHHGAESTQHLADLERLLRVALEESPPPPRPRGRRQPRSPDEQCWEVHEQRDEDSGHSVRLWTAVREDETDREAAAAGCAPGEFSSTTSYAEAALPEPRTLQDNLSPAAAAIRRRRQLDYIARAAQQLPRRWDRLQPGDIRHLLQELLVLRDSGPNAHCLQIPGPELAAFVAVCFWLSLPPDVCVRLTIIDALADLPRSAEPGSITYVRKARCWCLPILDAGVKGAAAAQRTGQARPRATRLLLPDVASIGDWLVPLLVAGAEAKAFRRPAAEYLTQVRRWLNAIDPIPPKRLTWSRLEATIFWTIAESSADLATAVLTLSRFHRDAKTQLHYYCPTIVDLQKAYHDACTSLLSFAHPPWPRGEPPPHLGGAGYAGSQLCPTLEAVRLLASGLAETVEQARHAHSSTNYLVDVHNAVATYTGAMLGFSTGYRSVADPLTSVEHFHLASRRVVIADKTSDAANGIRVAIVPEMLCKQLSLYLQHLRALALSLPILNPTTHRQLLALLNASRSEKPLPLLFLLQLDGSFVSMRPATVGPRFRAVGYRLALNANRHYLRTRLRERGASGEEVNSFMGHWQLGQEPFHPFATLGLDTLQERIAPLLQEILAETGWHPLPGLA